MRAETGTSPSVLHLLPPSRGGGRLPVTASSVGIAFWEA